MTDGTISNENSEILTENELEVIFTAARKLAEINPASAHKFISKQDSKLQTCSAETLDEWGALSQELSTLTTYLPAVNKNYK